MARLESGSSRGESMARQTEEATISAMMTLVNELTGAPQQHREILETYCRILNPFAPHLAEEVWATVLGHAPSVNEREWPEWSPEWLSEDVVTIVAQVNGKLRGRIEVPADADDASIETIARELPPVQAQLEGRTVRKVIVVPGKLINIVAN